MEKVHNQKRKRKDYLDEGLNTFKGVIKTRELSLATEEEIKVALYKQGGTQENQYQKERRNHLNEQIHTDI